MEPSNAQRAIHRWIRVSPFKLVSILKDGRFRTAFEGYMSLGADDALELRAAREQAYYGYPPDHPVEQRPVYGYLSRQEHGQAAHGHTLILDTYGTATIRLKDSIKARTTYCLGDWKLSCWDTSHPF